MVICTITVGLQENAYNILRHSRGAQQFGDGRWDDRAVDKEPCKRFRLYLVIFPLIQHIFSCQTPA